MVIGQKVITRRVSGSSAARPTPVGGRWAMRIVRFIFILSFRNSKLREVFLLVSALLRRAVHRVCRVISNGAVSNLQGVDPVLCVHAC